MDTRVAPNKVVSITYTIIDDTGELRERVDLPVSYLHGGRSNLFPQIEQALHDKCVGDVVSVRLAPEEGFGPHNPGLTFTDDLENVPEELRFLGAELEGQNAQGATMKFVVTEIRDGRLTVDANHPFAGKTVTFEVTVAGVRNASPEELMRGEPANTHGGLPVH